MKNKEIETINDDITIKMREAHLDVDLFEVWGGDGEVRYMQMEHKKLSREKSKSKSKSTMPEHTTVRKTTEIITELVDEPVNSFRLVDGKPVLNLGKKVRGTLKAIGINFARMEHPIFPSMTFVRDMMSMVNVEPEIAILSDDKKWMENGNYYLATSPQILNSAGKPMMTQHYDAIKKVKANIVIKYPSTFEPQVSAMISLLPSVKTFNRRSTTIKINEKTVHDAK
jgi:hypothetical protein